MEKEIFFAFVVFFFRPKIYHLAPGWKQEADGCHACIRNEFLKWVGTHEILQLNGMQKYGKNTVLTVANRTPKTFWGGSTGGPCCKWNANGPHGCDKHAKKWSWIWSECLKVPKMRTYEKPFCTKNSNIRY